MTGGAGYIGSHTCLCLLEKNFTVVIVDNLSNASEEAVDRTRKLAGARGTALFFHKASQHPPGQHAYPRRSYPDADRSGADIAGARHR